MRRTYARANKQPGASYVRTDKQPEPTWLPLTPCCTARATVTLTINRQGMPNCVGWSPLSSGSKKWGYTTAVTSPAGESLTPQQARQRGERAVV